MAWTGRQPVANQPVAKGGRPLPMGALPAPNKGGRPANQVQSGKGGAFQAGHPGAWQAKKAVQQVAQKGARGKGHAAPVTIEALHAEYEEWAHHLSDAVLDLNVPTEEVVSSWEKVMELRGNLLQVHGVTGAAQDAMSPPLTTENWKQTLQCSASKMLKRCPTKEELFYSVEELPDKSGFVATIAADFFQGGSYTGQPQTSKKLAEADAARLAVMHEYPESQPEMKQQAPAAGQKGQKGKAGPMPGEKRKAPEEQEPKGRLVQLVQTLLARPATKDDVRYDTVEVEGSEDGKFQSTLTLPNYNAEISYEGAVAPSKKEAEAKAAEMAVADLADLAAPLEEERRVKKQKVQQERFASIKEKKKNEKEQGTPA